MRLPGTQTWANGRQLLGAWGGHKVRPKEGHSSARPPTSLPSSFQKGLEAEAVRPAESRVQEGRGDPASPASAPRRRAEGVAVPPG